ncbi:hypothetical protein OROGR_001575 [Orobanche gracilis]
MVTPNMATITSSLERSLQNCSLNHQQSSNSSSSTSGGVAAHGSDSPPNLSTSPTLELNSQASLPVHWEQCLDLKTGEIYYINWRTGMKVKEDPRTGAEFGNCYSDDDSTSYDSEGSCPESPPSSSRGQRCATNSNQENCYYQENGKTENIRNSNINTNISSSSNNNNSHNNVLVVAGCKSCLMYYMVPKQNEICPKCCGRLLHFDRSENGSS